MKFTANRQIFGDYGLIPAGGVFEVDEAQAKRMQPLEAKGIIRRYREPRPFKAYTVYENKAVTPEATKTKR